MLAILRKDMREHLGLFVCLLVFSMLTTVVLIIGMQRLGQVMSYFGLTSMFASYAMLLVAIMLSQGLLTREYYGRTQRFIEALPVRPGIFQAVKYFLGLAALLLFAFLVWGLCAYIAQQHEVVSEQFYTLMAARLAAYTFALWSLVYFAAMLGRWRFVFLAILYLGINIISAQTSLDLQEFGPFALIAQENFAEERITWPVQALWETLAVGLVFSVAGVLLATARAGSLVENLSVPMSTAEKSALAVIVIVGAVIYSYFDEEEPDNEIAFHSDKTVNRGRVHISYLNERYRDDAEALLQVLFERIEALENYLDFPNSGYGVWVSLAPDLQHDRFETVRSSERYGELVMANFERSERWQDRLLVSYITHQLLSNKSKSRVLVEPKHWLVDGFAQWWADASENRSEKLGESFEPSVLMALYANERVSLTAATLTQWDTTVEALGDDLATALATFAWRTMEQHAGFEKTMAFAAEQFDRPAYGDARDWWQDKRRPYERSFASLLGMDLTAFAELVKLELAKLAQNPLYAMQLRSIPRGALLVRAEITEDFSRSLLYRIQPAAAWPASNCFALHWSMPAYSFPVYDGFSDDNEIDVTDTQLAKTVEYRINDEYGSGSLIYASVACRFPGLSSLVRIGGARVEMP